MKKITSLFLIIAVLLCSVVSSAYAAVENEITADAEAETSVVGESASEEADEEYEVGEKVEFYNPFEDVVGHWAEAHIAMAYECGMINGDPDGRFRPDDEITRAEFVKMLVAIFCERFDGYVSDTLDDGTHWASKYYNFALSAMFRPLDQDSAVDGIIPAKMSAEDFDKPIGRWEMAYLVSESMKNVCHIMGQETEDIFADVEDVEKNYSLTIADAIKNAYYMRIMIGDENGVLNAASTGTRAEAVIIVNRVDNLLLQIIAAEETQQQQIQQQQQEMIQKYKDSLKTYDEIPEGHPVVTVEMENGKKFKIELYPEYAPQTVANFVTLVESGFYDGLSFHRVVDGFMAQGGDPEGNGTGDSENYIVGEFASNGFADNTLSHTKGVVSMARSNYPDSASCQFFICFDDASFLDGEYAAFGKVIEGMENVEAFLESERTANAMGEIATPVQPIIMKKVTVEKAK